MSKFSKLGLRRVVGAAAIASVAALGLAGMGAGAGAGSVSALRGLYRSSHGGDVASVSCSLNALMLRGSSMRVKGRDRASCSSCASWPSDKTGAERGAAGGEGITVAGTGADADCSAAS